MLERRVKFSTLQLKGFRIGEGPAEQDARFRSDWHIQCCDCSLWIRSHKMTSWPSLRTDIRNAGGNWVDEEVVQDGLITTSRKPDDLPAFNREMLKSFAENSQLRE